MSTILDYDSFVKKFHLLLNDMKIKNSENEKLKKELEEIKAKYNTIRSKIRGICVPTPQLYLERLSNKAPNFWKVLSNVDTYQKHDYVYLFQLGLFYEQPKD